jgi:hypothetical protein
MAGPLRKLLPGIGQPGPALGPGWHRGLGEAAPSVELSTIFLDDVVEANAYVPAVPQLKEAAHNARRIGWALWAWAT